MNDKKVDVTSKRAIYFAASIFIGAIIIYFIKFHCLGESNQTTWGQFGDYMGGLVNPIIGLITIVFLSYNLNQNERLLTQSQDELKLTREELKRGQEIQKATESALNEQIKVAVYGRDLNNALAIYKNLESRAGELLKNRPEWQHDQQQLQADMACLDKRLSFPANQYFDTINMKFKLNHIIEEEHARLLKHYPPKI